MKNIIQLYSLQTSWRLRNDQISSYSDTIRTVVLIELTVPIEQSLADANLRKKCKYSEFVTECENRSWTTYYFPVEIGSRGFYNTSLPKCLSNYSVAKIALRGSYAI